MSPVLAATLAAQDLSAELLVAEGWAEFEKTKASIVKSLAAAKTEGARFVSHSDAFANSRSNLLNRLSVRHG